MADPLDLPYHPPVLTGVCCDLEDLHNGETSFHSSLAEDFFSACQRSLKASTAVDARAVTKHPHMESMYSATEATAKKPGPMDILMCVSPPSLYRARELSQHAQRGGMSESSLVGIQSMTEFYARWQVRRSMRSGSYRICWQVVSWFCLEVYILLSLGQSCFSSMILRILQHPSTIDRNFQMYDHLLFLQKGGETVYFGDLGHNVTTLIGYFQAHGSRQYKPEENLC